MLSDFKCYYTSVMDLHESVVLFVILGHYNCTNYVKRY